MRIAARRMLDVREGRILHDPVLRVVDGTIAECTFGEPPTAHDVVDLGDVTLLPGLIDPHQHLAFDASHDPVASLDALDDAALLDLMRANAQRALAAGITTIRDLGDRRYLSLELRDAIARGDETGPRILAAGPPITVTQGHCWFLGGEADGMEGVRAAVRERVARGVDVIKIMTTGGNLTPTRGAHESQYTQAELAAAVDEAHAHGRKLASHAHGGDGIRDSLRAGADSIEHCTFFTADGVEQEPALLDDLAASDTVISMTGGMVPGNGPVMAAIAQRLQAILGNHGRLHAGGARIVCGTDAGVGPSKPHDVLPYGVSDFLPSIGMSPAEAIASATATAADACGIAHLTGALEVGLAADLLAVGGDPLADPAAVHDVRAVFARGTRVR